MLICAAENALQITQNLSVAGEARESTMRAVLMSKMEHVNIPSARTCPWPTSGAWPRFKFTVRAVLGYC